jgi:energy-coupling factor transporter ATP-binding protein EcfA2
MPGVSRDQHVLRQLDLPASYETLVHRVGPEVAQLLVDPGEVTKDVMELAGLSVTGRREGALIPLVGASGTGKTTLARNLSTFLPENYSPTVVHEGDVSFEALRQATREGAPNRGDDRVVPVTIDHREATPPSAQELAEIKRFVRDNEIGARCLLLWPQVNAEQAAEMSRAYVEVAGRAPVDIPVVVEGPVRDTWQDVALNTLRLSNTMVGSIEDLGIHPRDYDPKGFDTIGAFLRQIADDFASFRLKLLRESRVPVKLVVVFASESSDPGVLTRMTSSTRYGALDASPLLASTPGTRIGKWWADRRGALTQTIVRLDAHAVYLAPTTTVPVLRRYGGEDVQKVLSDLGIARPGPKEVTDAVRRSDVGQLLLGNERSTSELRGTPSTQALPAFHLLAERGFNLGRDKGLNASLADAITEFMRVDELPSEAVRPEKGFLDNALIPDNAVPYENETLCIEYTWRKGDFLHTKHRAEVAEYILTKLRDYAVAQGWISL